MITDETNFDKFVLKSSNDVRKLNPTEHIIEVKADYICEYGVVIYWYLTIINNGKFITRTEAIDRLENMYSIGHKRYMTLNKFKKFYHITGKWSYKLSFSSRWKDKQIALFLNYFDHHYQSPKKMSFEHLYEMIESYFKRFPSGSIKMKYLNFDYGGQKEFNLFRITDKRKVSYTEIHPTDPHVHEIVFSLEYSLEDNPVTLSLYRDD